MVFVPTMLPIANAATTNASQPNVAVFQWDALQRPIRAARCFDVPRGVIGLRLPFGRGRVQLPLPTPAVPWGKQACDGVGNRTPEVGVTARPRPSGIALVRPSSVP